MFRVWIQNYLKTNKNFNVDNSHFRLEIVIKKIYQKIVVRISVFKKIVMLFLSLLFLNGCVEATAFLGPAITAGTSGNIYQATLSYGTNQVVLKSTGKSTMEHVIGFLDPKNEHKGDFSSILVSEVKSFNNNVEEIKTKAINQQDDFFAIVKKIHEKQN